MLISRDIPIKNFIEIEASIFQCAHFTFEGSSKAPQVFLQTTLYFPDQGDR